MKLLVVSDSHGNQKILENLKEKYEHQVDAMIHCGDSELQADDPSLNGYSTVMGNCDMDMRLPEELTLKVDDSILFIAHGHRHQIKSALLNISYSAQENNANCVFFGHSHLLGAEMLDGILYLNPGSVLLPRGGNEQSYAIVEKDDTQYMIQFLNLDHQLIEKLSFPTK